MKKVKFPTVVGQETVAINDLKFSIYMYFWLNFNKELFIILMNVNRNYHSLVNIFITSPSFSSLVFNKVFILISLDINYICFGKCGSSINSLILNVLNTQSEPCLEHWENNSWGYIVSRTITPVLGISHDFDLNMYIYVCSINHYKWKVIPWIFIPIMIQCIIKYNWGTLICLLNIHHY